MEMDFEDLCILFDRALLKRRDIDTISEGH